MIACPPVFSFLLEQQHHWGQQRLLLQLQQHLLPTAEPQWGPPGRKPRRAVHLRRQLHLHEGPAIGKVPLRQELQALLFTKGKHWFEEMSDVPKKSGKQWRFSFKPTAFQLQTKQSFLFSRYLFLLSEKREAPDICWLPWHSNYSIHYDQNQLKSSNHLNCVWKHTDNQSQSKRQPFNGFSKQPRWNVTQVLSLQLTVETKSSENVHLQHSEFTVSVWLNGCRTGWVQTTHS